MSNPTYLLARIMISNFKAVSAVELPLTDVTLLVGSNNSGKSSILQAAHFASRALLQATEANKQSTISLRELDYVPSEFYRELGHNSTWGNRYDSPESRVRFDFVSAEDQQPFVAEVALKSARNEGISVNPKMPSVLISMLRDQDRVFSAYIPGLAGIPLYEQFISTRNVFRKAASGDSNVVLRNILWLLNEAGELRRAVDALRDVYQDRQIRIKVVYDDRSDYNIGVELHTTGMTSNKPIELAGTGFLQLLQIFSYLYLFHPAILLIDEPEAHLHPTLQTRFVQVLQSRVREMGTRVLISTHSPFIARGLAFEAQTAWVDGGKLAASSQGTEIREALGWGALDRQVVVCAEDKDTRKLDSLFSQDAELSRVVAVIPFSGVSKLGTAHAIDAFRKALGKKHRVVVYRDRDCLTDSELDIWFEEYGNYGFLKLISDGVELENYFCDPRMISMLYKRPLNEINTLIDTILDSNSDRVFKKFSDKRKEANNRFYPLGGSPSTQELWDQWGLDRRVSGKFLISKLYEALVAEGQQRISLELTREDVIVGLQLVQEARALLL